MATQTQQQTGPAQDQHVERMFEEVRQLYADAPQLARTALDNGLPELMAQVAAAGGSQTQSAGRVGIRQGKVSELTVIAPFAPGGAKRLRALLRLLNGKFDADRVGTVHDMRFVFLDNDTKLLFATAYDGEWDPYIDDFATRIPDSMDILFANFDGWPGIRDPRVKAWIVEHQIAAEAWYVANDLTVAETRRLTRVGRVLDEFLDKLAG